MMLAMLVTYQLQLELSADGRVVYIYIGVVIAQIQECTDALHVLLITVAVDGAGGTMTRTFRSILTSDGVAGLYRGLAANFLKVAPAVSISYIVYEKSRGVLGVTMT